MLSLRRRLPAARVRAEAVRQLYRRSRAENKSDARGLRLLRRWLSPEQRAQFDASGYFEVVGGDSGMRYRIYHGSATNVYQMDYAGHCPLVHAAANGQLDACSFLLQCDWSLSHDRRPNRNEALQQALVIAASTGHVAVRVCVRACVCMRVRACLRACVRARCM